MPPLIVTLDLDADTQDRFDQLRTRYFPARRNVLSAHVTLFHALPGEREDEVADLLHRLSDRSPIPVEVSRVRLLGKGVAFDLAAPDAARLREQVADRFRADLTRQDGQRQRLHVTVANKLEPEKAREIADELSAGFRPSRATAVAVSLYRYRGGPWEHVATFPFGGG